MTELDIELVLDPERLGALKAEWDAFLSAMGNLGSVFMYHSWYDCWWRHFSDGATLFVLVARKRGRVVGIAPLMRRWVNLHGLPVRAIVFVANGNSLHNDLLVHEEHRAEVLREFCRFLHSRRDCWDLLQFHHVPADSPNCTVLADRGVQNWFSFHPSSSYDSPYLVMGGDWRNFLSSRSQRVRKTLRNIGNTLGRSGEIEVSEVTSWEEFVQVREGVLHVAGNSWTQWVGDSLAHPVNAGFFADLARDAAGQSWLSLWLLRLDGRIIAFEFHLRGCGKQHALRASFDEEFRQFSPGAFLEAEILKRLFDEPDGISRFDFGGSFDDYKKRWSDTSLDHVTLSAFNGGLYSRVAALHELGVVKTARLLRDQLRKGHGKS